MSFKQKKGYSRINLHSRKEKDIRAISAAEKREKPSVVFIKSKGKVHNPDTSSNQKKMQRGDALFVQGIKRNDGLIEATYKYKKNMAKK